MNESVFSSHYAELLARSGESAPPRGGSDIERWLKKETKRRDKARRVHKAVCLAIAERGRPVELARMGDYRSSIESAARATLGVITTFFLGWMLKFLVSIVIDWVLQSMAGGKMSAGDMASLKEWGAKP